MPESSWDWTSKASPSLKTIEFRRKLVCLNRLKFENYTDSFNFEMY